jgi:hypothetical protein
LENSFYFIYFFFIFDDKNRTQRRKKEKKEISKNPQTHKRKKKKKQEWQLLLVALSFVPHCSLGSRLNAVCVSARQHGRLILIVRAIFSFFFSLSLSTKSILLIEFHTHTQSPQSSTLFSTPVLFSLYFTSSQLAIENSFWDFVYFFLSPVRYHDIS